MKYKSNFAYNLARMNGWLKEFREKSSAAYVWSTKNNWIFKTQENKILVL